MRLFSVLTIFLLLTVSLKAQLLDTTTVQYDEAAMQDLYAQYMDSVVNTLSYETGTVVIGDGLATIVVPAGFKYLNGPDSDMVLTDLWGNPPSDEPSLGMLFPADSDPSDYDNYAIEISYDAEGYIDDSDAKGINYKKLLKQMQQDAVAYNEQRIEMGYEPIELVGWASEPFYDETNKKLHWAKELKFGDAEENTLNYNIIVLGRKGYITLNVIGEMVILPEVQTNIDQILPSVTFNEGNRYADFNPNIDKVAAIGIGGLIAGKVLAKTGLLAAIGIFLAKMWKIILIALVASGAGLRRFFSKKKTTESAPPTA